jgi:hypothetical protein
VEASGAKTRRDNFAPSPQSAEKHTEQHRIVLFLHPDRFVRHL